MSSDVAVASTARHEFDTDAFEGMADHAAYHSANCHMGSQSWALAGLNVCSGHRNIQNLTQNFDARFDGHRRVVVEFWLCRDTSRKNAVLYTYFFLVQPFYPFNQALTLIGDKLGLNGKTIRDEPDNLPFKSAQIIEIDNDFVTKLRFGRTT